MAKKKQPWEKDRAPENNTLIDSLMPGINSVLGVRDSIGAKKRDVFLLTRTWSGKSVGEGNYLDKIVKVEPTPYIVDYSHSLMTHEGGAIRSGDIIVRGISKKSYPDESELDCRVDQRSLNVQKFYFINNWEYTVIHIKDNYVTWDVQIRKVSSEASKVVQTK